jgi:hypothetical protein
MSVCGSVSSFRLCVCVWGGYLSGRDYDNKEEINHTWLCTNIRVCFLECLKKLMRSVWIVAGRMQFETWVPLNETSSRYSKRVCVDIS